MPRLGVPIWIALGAFIFGLSATLGLASLFSSRPPPSTVNFVGDLDPTITIASQLTTDDVAEVKRHGYRTIIAMRPDGEAPDQPSSETMARTAQGLGMSFAYIPIPHESLPDSQIDMLEQTLATHEGPTLLYCRTGRRAARSWALMEASRPGGMTAADIEERVKHLNFDMTDLRGRVEERIARRSKKPES